ncbi:hypothetical protein SELMODRAFT_86904 [Selaginella moellendorffii]|uniref:Enoyl reductase (ER) domain-containing protein n=1 Tax=Selaginella moellendorffii TaxID=88036 RepID=D8R7W7_SELML|nr:quinone oxidoreductase PIG3 [Selaginella moellendorffii]EFJ31952.1 hypothetical protein SELMODRAFT_86904 [Selaginella moellendorffii]|eukprot:XP_002967353.1 quinone oxidoreductase PIG3 [Selaginella moellendorffii]
MRAVVAKGLGGPEVLELREVPDPDIGDDEVLIKVAAAGVNRADLLQLKGQHPPPPGAPPYLGLECSGVIERLGARVDGWKVGDEVCALLGGGGYAEKVAVAASQLLPIPRGVSLRDAASLPEVACTVWSTVFMACHLSAGESVLIHGGSSGIGTFAIQMAKSIGAQVFATAGSEKKLDLCKQLGAEVAINYKEDDFVARVKEATHGEGVDVVLDMVGASYFERNLEALGMDGRLFIIGFQGGASGQLSLLPILKKRLIVSAAGLRTRAPESKAQIVAEVWQNVWPAVEERKVKPVIYRVFPLEEAAQALQLMVANQHFGKILLTP